MDKCFLKVVVAAVLIGLWGCSKSPLVAISETDTDVSLLTENAEWSFQIYDPWDAEGVIIGASKLKGSLDAFSGTFGLVKGHLASELAFVRDPGNLSSEAREIVQEYGCAADYLNENTVSFMAVSANVDIDRALRSVEEKDEVIILGNRLAFNRANLKGSAINFSSNLPDIVYVRGVTVNGKSY